jgi:hypothetical protein
MHACMLWLLPVSTLQCGFPHLGRMKTTKYLTCRTQFPCMSDCMNNLPKDATGYIYPILNRDSFCKPERKKREKKLFSMSSFKLYFVFSLPSIIPNLNLIRLRIPPLNSAAKNCNEYLQLLFPHTQSLCVLACTLLLFIHMICRSPPSKKRIDATIK